MDREIINKLSNKYFKLMCSLIKEENDDSILMNQVLKIEGFKSAIMIVGGLELMEQVEKQWQEYYDREQVQEQTNRDIQI